MSGPKLSAFELEERRKKELERKQREIAAENAKSMHCIQEAQRLLKTLDRERGCLLQQQRMLESSMLSNGEKQSIRTAIERRLNMLNDVERARKLVPTTVGYSETPEAARAQYSTISEKLGKCRSANERYTGTRGNYEAALAPLAQKLCDSVRVNGFPLEQALSELPPRVVTQVLEREEQADLSEEKAELIAKAQKIIDNANASETFREEARNAIVRIDCAADKRELHSVRSLILDEIERKLEKIEPLLEGYHELLSRKNALAAACGNGEIELPGSFDSKEALQNTMQQLRAEIEAEEQKALRKAEQREIAMAIDLAMKELGYPLLGAKNGGSDSHVKMKIFQFDEQTGLEVRQDVIGQIRIRVVGMANEEKKPTEKDADLLLTEQQKFCGEYDKIVKKLQEKGVRRSKEICRMEPDTRHAAYVNMVDYGTTAPAKPSTTATPAQLHVEAKKETQKQQRRSTKKVNKQEKYQKVSKQERSAQ
ncbi:hypothetical protein WMO66_12510 [Faecousia sp. CLA-AA-H192]|jgi:hypothetical protein|uniref:Uncharacterized protein n=1 Tax=Faecousia intestinalis TaxID=3133167 RepID=A0ABV1G9J0_9FIRM